MPEAHRDTIAASLKAKIILPFDFKGKIDKARLANNIHKTSKASSRADSNSKKRSFQGKKV